MNRGALYKVEKHDRGSFTGIFLREGETKGTLEFYGSGDLIYSIEESEILCTKELSPSIHSNVHKLFLSKYLDLEDIFEERIVCVVEVNGRGDLPLLYIYIEKDQHVYRRYYNSGRPKTPHIDGLEVGATYVFEDKRSPNIVGGIFVGLFEQRSVCVFVVNGKEYHLPVDRLMGFYKVKDAEYLSLSPYIEDSEKSVAVVVQNGCWKVFRVSEEDPQEMTWTIFQILTEPPPGIFWGPVREKMYWGTFEYPYLRELRSGDQIRSTEISDPIFFVDRVTRHDVWLITSSDVFPQFLHPNEQFSFPTYLGVENQEWYYVPKEDHPTYQWKTALRSWDRFQKMHLQYLIAEENILHIEFLDTGLIHIYYLQDNLLKRETLVAESSCLTNHGRRVCSLYGTDISILTLGISYSIELTNGDRFVGIFVEEISSHFDFVDMADQNYRCVIPKDIVKIVPNEWLPEENPLPEGYCVIKTRDDCHTGAKYIEKDRAVPFMVDKRLFRRETADQSLLIGF